MFYLQFAWKRKINYFCFSIKNTFSFTGITGNLIIENFSKLFFRYQFNALVIINGSKYTYQRQLIFNIISFS